MRLLAALVMAVWRKSRFEWHIGQATTMASAPSARASSRMRAAEPHHRGGAATARRRRRSTRPHVPVDGVGAAGRDDLLHRAGLLGVVVAGDLGGPHQQAAVVGGQLDAARAVGRSAAAILLDRAARVAQQLDDVAHLDAVGERAGRGCRGMRAASPLRCDARGAPPRGGCSRPRRAPAPGRSPVPRPARGCAPAAPRRAGDRSRAPMLAPQHDQSSISVRLDAERGGDGAQALVELARGAVQRTAGVVAGLLGASRAVPSLTGPSHSSKMRVISSIAVDAVGAQAAACRGSTSRARWSRPPSARRCAACTSMTMPISCRRPLARICSRNALWKARDVARQAGDAGVEAHLAQGVDDARRVAAVRAARRAGLAGEAQPDRLVGEGLLAAVLDDQAHDVVRPQIGLRPWGSRPSTCRTGSRWRR